MNAKREYDRLLENVKEEIHGSAIGIGFFFAQSECLGEQGFREAALRAINKQPGAADALVAFLLDEVEQYAQREASNRQFGRGRFPPGPKSIKPLMEEMFKDFRSGAAFGIPQTKE